MADPLMIFLSEIFSAYPESTRQEEVRQELFRGIARQYDMLTDENLRPEEVYTLIGSSLGTIYHAYSLLSEGACGKQPLSGSNHVNTVSVPITDIASINVAYLDETVVLRHTSDDDLQLREHFDRSDNTLFAAVQHPENQIDIQHGSRRNSERAFVELLIPSNWGGTLSITTQNGRCIPRIIGI